MIELKNITVVKAGAALFKDFSLHIKEGEHWVVQGNNGSGKTLLLQVIAGALHATSGEVRYSFIKGDNWDSLYQQRLQLIHFIPTHWMQTFLHGSDGLFYQQRYYAVDDTQLPKVRDVFGDDIDKLGSLNFSERFNIEHLLDVEITRLSNGQLKKVIIMRQLIRNIPRFLLLDYAFDGLDAGSRADLSAFIDELAVRFGIQMIMADHGPLLPKVINRRLVLRNFSIAAAGVLKPADHADTGFHPPVIPDQSDGEPVVEMRDLTIAYSGKKIISNLNWRIARGERWALTGRNGSGKTTLFSLIYADHPMAYSQRVYLFGRRRGSGESIWDIKKRINYFGPEQIHFLGAHAIAASAREYILSQAGKQSAGLAELIRFFRADPYIDKPLRQLSSGQLQIILLMNMFLDKRELLLLDEPFQFLDPENHDRVTRYLNDYLDKTITLILITHDERDVARWTQHRMRLP